jgi:hypothetical protein
LSEAGSSAGPNPGNNGNTPGNLALLSKNFKVNSRIVRMNE